MDSCEALLAKWGWRYKSGDSSLWTNVIDAVHGGRPNWDFIPVRKGMGGVWCNIVKTVSKICIKGVPLKMFIKGKVGRGDMIRFWLDPWVGNETLKDKFKSLFHLEKQKHCKVKDRLGSMAGVLGYSWNWSRLPREEGERHELDQLLTMLSQVSLNNSNDRWVWTGGKEEGFKVKDVKTLLTAVVDSGRYVPPRCKWVPIKCRIFAWRAELGRIPTAIALKNRNIGIANTMCLLCEFSDENADHLFTSCYVATAFWQKISVWCKVQQNFAFSVTDLLELHKYMRLPDPTKEIFKGIIIIGCWSIWRARNNWKFNNKKTRIEELVSEKSYIYNIQMADEEAEQWRPEVKSIATVDIMDVSDILNFDNIGENIDGTTNGEFEILHETGQTEIRGSSNNIVQIVEEEIAEVEFEKVKPKLATHSMHCPNCKSEISKVILRRKVLSRRPTRQESVAQVEPQPEQKDLVGCFSCLSLFTCSDNGCFNPFEIFRKRAEMVRLLSSDPPQSSNPTGDVGSMIITEDEPETIAVVTQSRGRTWPGYDGILAEILKSIVYGGLMEVIASLSVVASAAASNVTTLSIVYLALASLIGGVFILGHNLWDLRDDCYKDSSRQKTNKATTTYKYKELLGQVNYFPLHASFAILSFLLFGIIPPVAYRYSYHETKDKGYALMVAAISSLLCVSLLAIIKAYINKCKVLVYSKTLLYYIILAVLVSGVSYVVGNLVARLLEKFGWFDTRKGANVPCLPHATSPYLDLETF